MHGENLKLINIYLCEHFKCQRTKTNFNLVIFQACRNLMRVFESILCSVLELNIDSTTSDTR